MAHNHRRWIWSAACFLGGVLLWGSALAQAQAPPGPEARQIGARLLQRLQSGAIRLTNPTREGPQLRQIAAIGAVKDASGKPVPISLALLRTLDRLSARSSKQKPLEVMSLYRPARTSGSREAHAIGMGVDIAAFAGFRIDSSSPERCVKGVIALVNALGPGQYRMGLPKPADTDPAAFLPPPVRPPRWSFFPAPLPYTYRIMGLSLVMPRHGGARSARGVRPWVARWENERGAPIEDIGDRRVRLALRNALARKANLYALFPDALDHVHLDVRPLHPPSR